MRGEGRQMRDVLIGTVLRGPQDPAGAIRELAPLGFESFSIFFWQTLGFIDLPTLARKVRSAAQETGTVISSLGIYGNVLLGDAAAGETLHGFQALITAAETFGTDLVCGFAGIVPDVTIAESLGPWKRVFGTLVQRAEDHGVRLAM